MTISCSTPYFLQDNLKLNHATNSIIQVLPELKNTPKKEEIQNKEKYNLTSILLVAYIISIKKTALILLKNVQHKRLFNGSS